MKQTILTIATLALVLSLTSCKETVAQSSEESAEKISSTANSEVIIEEDAAKEEVSTQEIIEDTESTDSTETVENDSIKE